VGSIFIASNHQFCYNSEYTPFVAKSVWGDG